MKAKLQRLIEAGRAKEAEVLMPNIDDSEPDVPGRWTTKDVVAHMTSWREVATGEINSLLTGSSVPEISDDDDLENEKFYARTHPLPAQSILESARHSWAELAAAVDACTEEDLLRPRPRYPSSQKLFHVVTGNYFHVGEHIGYWYSDQGNQAEAEKAALWSYELVSSVMPEDERRGVAEYNLACFYAKQGQGAQALPHVARAFELRPDLRDSARTDSDLTPIRSDPEFAKLLG